MSFLRHAFFKCISCRKATTTTRIFSLPVDFLGALRFTRRIKLWVSPVLASPELALSVMSLLVNCPPLEMTIYRP